MRFRFLEHRAGWPGDRRLDESGACERRGDAVVVRRVRVRGFPALFVAACLSTWGDFIARLTIAAVVYERTESPLATATTLVVSTVPAVFGRTLLGPLADRLPYKRVLIGSHVARAICVLLLLWLVAVQAPITALFSGSSCWSSAVVQPRAPTRLLMTDLFTDRRLFLRALGSVPWPSRPTRRSAW